MKGMSRYQSILAEKEPWTQDWDRFCAELRCHPDGHTIIENCMRECQFATGEQDTYKAFLKRAVGEFLKSAHPVDVKKAYENACHSYQRRGRLACLEPQTILHRFVDKQALFQRFCAVHNDIPSGKRKAHWQALERVAEQGDPDPGRQAMAERALRGFPMAHHGFQVFAGFDPSKPSDSGVYKSEQLPRLLERNGLPWTKAGSGYGPGTRIWCLRWSADHGVVSFVPTVADAAWYPEFLPCDNPDATHGFTRVLSVPFDQGAFGEVVHAQPSSPMPQKIPLDMGVVP